LIIGNINVAIRSPELGDEMIQLKDNKLSEHSETVCCYCVVWLRNWSGQHITWHRICLRHHWNWM